MMKWFLMAVVCLMPSVVLARADRNDTVLDSIGNIVKSALQEPTTTTVAPNFVEGALTGGRNYVEKQVGAHKEEVMHAFGDLAEKVGLNRGVAEMVGANMLEQGIKKGKELLTRHQVAENVDKAKEGAKADSDLDKAISEAKDTDASGTKTKDTGIESSVVNEVGDKGNTTETEEEDDLEEPMVLKKVDLKKQGV